MLQRKEFWTNILKKKFCWINSLAVMLSLTTRTTNRISPEILPESSKAASKSRELHLFLIHERPSLQWLSRKHLPSFSLQGLVFEQIFFSVRPEKKFQYLQASSSDNTGVIFFGESQTFLNEIRIFLNKNTYFVTT